MRTRPLRPRPGRIVGGRRAVAGGQRAEDLILWVLRRLDEQGLAWIKKTEPPTGIDAKGRRFFKRKGAPDFMGALQSGRHVVFEAKSTRERTFRWPEGMHHTRERQIMDLERAGGIYNALAGVLVLFWPSARHLVGEAWPRLVWVHWAGARTLAEGAWDADSLAEQPWAAEAHWPVDGDPAILDAAMLTEARWEAAQPWRKRAFEGPR
ncbi:MAG: hypothetical protein QN174_07680 [Armatimonadota bacterium]|nr:hypothetical protein [Armatimonadota bacterium]